MNDAAVWQSGRLRTPVELEHARAKRMVVQDPERGVVPEPQRQPNPATKWRKRLVRAEAIALSKLKAMGWVAPPGWLAEQRSRAEAVDRLVASGKLRRLPICDGKLRYEEVLP